MSADRFLISGTVGAIRIHCSRQLPGLGPTQVCEVRDRLNMSLDMSAGRLQGVLNRVGSF